MGRLPIDLTGRRFGELSVIKRTDNRRRAGSQATWVCLCAACGNQVEVKDAALRAHRKPTCDCFKAKRKQGRTFFDLAMTHKEIGEVLGLTRERVRQIEAAALRKLEAQPELLDTLVQLSQARQDRVPPPPMGFGI